MPWVWVAVVAAWMASAPVRAQDRPDPDERIGALRESVTYARYEEAVSGARALLEYPSLTAVQRNTALEILAIAQLARRDQRGALETLGLLYGRDPDHRLGDRDAGPNVQAAFERARDARATPVAVTIERDVPEALAQRAAPVITVRITAGADAVHELRLGYRQSDGPFNRVLLVGTEDATVARGRIPLLEGEDAYQVDWYVEAVAPSGVVLGRLGSEAEPQRVAVPRADPRQRVRIVRVPGATAATPLREDSPGILERWWFWTAVGVVVIGAAVAVFIVTRPPDDAPQGSLPGLEL